MEQKQSAGFEPLAVEIAALGSEQMQRNRVAGKGVDGDEIEIM